MFRETASGAKTDRPQLRRALAALAAGDALMVTRLDRLAQSTRDLLNTLATIAGKEAGFRSLGDAWADTTTSHGRLMLTVLGGLADFQRELIRARERRPGTSRGAWREAWHETQADAVPGERSDQAPRPGRRDVAGDRPQLQREPQHDLEARSVIEQHFRTKAKQI